MDSQWFCAEIQKENGNMNKCIENCRLAVKETKGRGWWLPAGSVNEDESYEEAAHRQTIEVSVCNIYIYNI